MVFILAMPVDVPSDCFAKSKTCEKYFVESGIVMVKDLEPALRGSVEYVGHT